MLVVYSFDVLTTSRSNGQLSNTRYDLLRRHLFSLMLTESKSKKKRKNKKKNAAAKAATEPQAHQNATQQPEQENGDDESEASEHEQEESDVQPTATSETSIDEDTVSALTNGTNNMNISDDIATAAARFDALVRDRDALREEVTRLRQSLEEVQSNHERQIQDVQAQLQDEKSERETAEENYQNLLGKVNTIRSQLGERLKADAVWPYIE